MQAGRCCQCKGGERSVTLKGLQASDGVTQWEWGPGWKAARVYGSTDFVALTHDNTTGNNVAATVSGNRFRASYNTGSDSYVNNSRRGVTIADIDGTAGTDTTTAVDWILDIYSPDYPQSVNLFGGGDSAGLSGGEMAINGHVAPAVEFVTKTNLTTTATKVYEFLPHTQQAGNIYLKTARGFGTSLSLQSTVTVAHNSTAAAMATAVAAASDVSSASATGGPWPHSAITLTVTFANADGHIDHMLNDTRYVVATFPSTIYRSTAAAVFTIDPSTGGIASDVGYLMGNGSGSSGDFLLPSGLPFPTTTTPRTAGAYSIEAAASGRFVCQSQGATSGTFQRTLEAWSYSGGTWSQDWVRLHNTSSVRTRGMHVEDDTACVSVLCGVYGGNRTVALKFDVSTNTRSQLDGGNVTLDTWSLTRLNSGSSAGRHTYRAQVVVPDTGGAQYYTEDAHDVNDGTDNWHLGVGEAGYIYGTVTGNVVGEPRQKLAPPSAGPSELRTDQGFNTRRIQFASFTPSGSAANGLAVSWYWPPGFRSGGTTEWRLGWDEPGAATVYTSWLAWDATEAQIEAAIIGALGENTEGVYSNVNLWALGKTQPDNTCAAYEAGLYIQFLTSPDPDNNPFGFIDSRRLTAVRDRHRIEFRNYQEQAPHSVAAWSTADGGVTWSRYYGFVGTQPITWLRRAWCDGGSWVWLAGPVVDPD